MKKYIVYVLMVFLYTSGSFAQSMDDVLRFVRPELKGSARFTAMGGAFNALGGDLSAIKDNPAGAAVFLNSELGMTINSIDNKMDATYFGNTNPVDSRSFEFEQFGMVLVLNNTAGDDQFLKISLGYNYQNERIYNDKYNAIGENPNRGLDDYFLFFANGVPYEDIKTYDNEPLSTSYRFLGENRGFSSQQAFLGYQGFVINPVSTQDGNTQYVSNSNPQGGPVQHNYFVTRTGKNTKNTFTLAAQYQQNLYLGLNLNSHRMEFKRVDNLIEDNYGLGSTFNYTEFQNELFTVGNGFSFQLGGIYKANENIRISLSYQSPIWYEMTDELLQFIISSKSNGTDTVDPQVVNVYDYNFSTPSIFSGGLAYIFGTQGLISLQYDFSSFQNTQFDIGEGDKNFINQNERIKKNLQSAGVLRLGGEYRIDRFSLRAGYFNQQSINKTSNDLSNGFTGGLGYDFGGSILNLSLTQSEYQHSERIYQDGLTDPIRLNKDQIQFLVSYSFKL